MSIISIGVVVSSVLYENLVENSKQTYSYVFNGYINTFSSIIDTAKSEMLTLGITKNTQEFLRRINRENFSLYSHRLVRYSEDFNRLCTQKYFNLVTERTNRIHYDCVLYGIDNNGQFVSQIQADIPRVIQDEKKMELLQKAQYAPYTFIYNYDSTLGSYLDIYKSIIDTTNWNTVIGVLEIRIHIADINSNILIPLEYIHNIKTNIFLINKEETIPVGNYSLIRNDFEQNENEYIKDDYFYMRRTIARSQFMLIGRVPSVHLARLFLDISKLLFPIIIVMLGLAFLITNLMSKKITSSIVSLADTMKEMQNGSLDIRVKTHEKGEIYDLYNSFNYMIDTINELIEKTYMTQIKQKDLELSTLQSQINTHFLYNTLDTINWLAKEYNVTEISSMVISLSSFLRISLSNGKDVITIEDEIRHVKAYLDIQKIRYSKKFQVKIHVDKSAEQHNTLKMLLQPLVENALYHGIDKDKKNNIIKINVFHEGDYIKMQVANSGVSIDIDKINAIINSGENDELKTYGVKSINKRLELRYNIDYKYFYSANDNYTVANIIFPVKGPLV